MDLTYSMYIYLWNLTWRPHAPERSQRVIRPSRRTFLHVLIAMTHLCLGRPHMPVFADDGWNPLQSSVTAISLTTYLSSPYSSKS
jgi:hypothetical protein